MSRRQIVWWHPRAWTIARHRILLRRPTRRGDRYRSWQFGPLEIRKWEASS